MLAPETLLSKQWPQNDFQTRTSKSRASIRGGIHQQRPSHVRTSNATKSNKTLLSCNMNFKQMRYNLCKKEFAQSRA